MTHKLNTAQQRHNYGHHVSYILQAFTEAQSQILIEVTTWIHMVPNAAM